ncbi:response regulator [Ideonella sp.]|uniref:response regulator n=1 Tax=Ideonella sp. TaxID=1929293 RepID=UPI0035B10D06
MTAPPPRVLLVEDDASIARFVQMATADMPLRLDTVASVSAARDALAAEPAALVMTDLMLGGESGLALLQTLHAQPALRAGARLVVFSAGLTEAVRRSLEGMDVWRVLGKPASLAALRGCIEEALAAGPAPVPAAAPAVPVVPVVPIVGGPSPRTLALQRFGGDAALFDAYRAGCLAQFTHDLAEGDDAAAQGNVPVLHHLGHALKSVLRLIGEEPAADDAAALERAGAAGDAATARAGWAAVRATLVRLLAEDAGAGG